MNVLNKYTVKNLRKNKTRTIVTIIGIVLSAAMFTAVTTFISSLQLFLIDTVKANSGSWHTALYSVSDADYDTLKGDSRVQGCADCTAEGYAYLENCQNPDKPYIYVCAADSGFFEKMPVNVTSGRLPLNDTEILLPEHLYENGGVAYSLGDTVTLPLGTRSVDGKTVWQSSSYDSAEEFTETGTLTCTVVGFSSRPGFEGYNAPGYTAYTGKSVSGTGAGHHDMYLTMRNAADAYKIVEESPASAYKYNINTDLMRFTGQSNEDVFNRVLYSLAGILIIIIMFASVSLIYNAFSISVSERTRQFGLISSLGATKKQLMRSVVFEALSLSVIGIPIGLLIGVGGIGITLKALEGTFAQTFGENIMNRNVALRLAVSPESLVIAAVIALVTVLVSAYIPARRSVKLSAIDAIRQTGDINIKGRQVKTSKLTYKLFGFEGMIASKNFKRNRRRYRATVVSLFMSVVLFISASSFSSYMSNALNSIMDDVNFDLMYGVDSDSVTDEAKLSALYERMGSASAVTNKCSYSYRMGSIVLDDSTVNMDMAKAAKEYFGDDYFGTEAGKYRIPTMLVYLDDDSFASYLNSHGLSRDTYMNTEKPAAVMFDNVKYLNAKEGRYYTFNAMKSGNVESTLEIQCAPEGYSYGGAGTDEDGRSYVKYTADEETSGEPIKKVYSDEGPYTRTESSFIGARQTEPPFGIVTGGCIVLVYPQSAMKTMTGTTPVKNGVSMCFDSDDHKTTNKEMVSILTSEKMPTSTLVDYADNMEANRSIILVVNVFSYGFIILISLISAANVFNTISTNISLRRREFAVLRSIGMTEKGFRRMMNYECLLYGLKGLVYGLPASVLVTWLIYRAVLNGWETAFYMPGWPIALAVVSVFAVVFATMLYAMHKVNKQNTVDALKNENI